MNNFNQVSPFESPRQVLPFILNQRGLTGIGVEVGVCRGIFSEHILKHWTGSLLYLVDPWGKLDDYPEDYSFEDDYAEMIGRMKNFPNRHEILRQTSLEAASAFVDNTLDFCYIDANHAYKNVLEDLEAWYPKVRPGGIMSGDDYGLAPETPVCFGKGQEYLCGVRRAVEEFSLKVGRNVSIDWHAEWNCAYRVHGDETMHEVRARNFWWIK